MSHLEKHLKERTTACTELSRRIKEEKGGKWAAGIKAGWLLSAIADATERDYRETVSEHEWTANLEAKHAYDVLWRAAEEHSLGELALKTNLAYFVSPGRAARRKITRLEKKMMGDTPALAAEPIDPFSEIP